MPGQITNKERCSLRIKDRLPIGTGTSCGLKLFRLWMPFVSWSFSIRLEKNVHNNKAKVVSTNNVGIQSNKGVLVGYDCE
jgi:hypothetical protein